MANEKEIEERIRFLITQHHQQSNLFWTRTYIFLTISTIGLGLATHILRTEKPIDPWIIFMISIAGIIFSVIWVQINRMSKYYEDRWLVDARNVLQDGSNSEINKLRSVFYYSLGFYEQYVKNQKEKPVKRSFSSAPRPSGFSATNCMYIVIMTLFIGWSALATWAVTKISNKYMNTSIFFGICIVILLILFVIFVMHAKEIYHILKKVKPKIKI